MTWINLKRILRTGFVNFWRNGMVSLSAVLVMIITLLIISTVVFSDALLKHSLISLENKVDININLLPEASQDSIDRIKNDLETLPQIETVQMLTREEVLENFIQNNQDEQTTLSALELLDDNPFGVALKIRAVDLSQYEVINSFLVDNYAVGTVNSVIDDVNFSEKEKVINRLEQIIGAGEKFGAVVTVIFILLSILITLNTIRLAMYISRDEIRVMNLVGANRNYITGPFIVAGAIYGVVSAVAVLIVLWPITYYLGGYSAEAFFGLNIFTYFIENFGQIFLIIMFSGILIGSISSGLAINRYLKKK
jgi:cell division transport system permease protein